MKNSKARIYVKNGRKGLDIYLDVDGVAHYLTTRRQNSRIWFSLKDGISLGDLRRLKPKKSKAEQRYYHSTSHMLRIANDFIKHELTAQKEIKNEKNNFKRGRENHGKQ